MGSDLPEEKQDYQQAAENIRARARDACDAEARGQLLLIASLYDKLAEHLPLAIQAKGPDISRPEDPTESPESA